ncbi:hypothetical protein [Yonghaparkia sp. Root332]|uniref:hypothetical protein n=1 Tax=Yonghaparkia sp. Root332 TaxID=1736516 RepID=UPI0006FDFD36|nr:hypothetical protein [Yonghaparkia sp. Root332]KQV25686.1 hypothetical protein ASC54_01425 [Yonghaparkia sp. Root332]
MSTDTTYGPGPSGAAALEPLRPRVSTIIWGVILVGIAALALLAELGWLDELPNGSVPIILVAGVGGLLVIGAIIGAATSGARRESRASGITGD